MTELKENPVIKEIIELAAQSAAEKQISVVNDIISMITQKRNNAEMKEMTVSDNMEAERYGTEAWVLTQVLRDIEDILYIHRKHQREIEEQKEMQRIDYLELESYEDDNDEQSIASWEQGHGGE